MDYLFEFAILVVPEDNAAHMKFRQRRGKPLCEP
jgi:hypothetical protein